MTTWRRHATEKIITVVCLLATLAVVGALFMIIGQVFIAGLPSLSWYFITTPENAANGLGAGIANAIVGTILISFSATIVAAPFGFGTAVYMKRYAADNGVTRSFRFLLEVMSGTPSVVIGIFGFLIFVIYMKQITGGFSLIAGTLALAILIMPVIERSIEDAIDRVSPELEEGSYSLGADKWQTIRGITIPTAFPGVLTGLSLGFGRAAEESAIVLLTAGYTQYMPELGIQSVKGAFGGVKIYPLQDSVGTLPYDVYHNFASAGLAKPSSGFAAAFVLIVIVFSINIAGKALLSYGFGGGTTSEGLFLGVIKKKLFPVPATGTKAIDPDINRKQLSMPTDKDSIVEKITKRALSIGSITTAAMKKAPNKNSTDTMTRQSFPGIPVKTLGQVPQPDLFEDQSMDPRLPSDEETVPAVRLNDENPTHPPGKKRSFPSSSGIKQLFAKLRNWIHIPELNKQKKSVRENTDMGRDSTDRAGSMVKPNPVQGRLSGSLRPFLLTLAPFALVAAILAILTVIMPGLSLGGSGGAAGLLTVLLISLVLCAIGTLGSLFLLKQGKIRMRNRRTRLAAVVLGIGLIFIAACLFTGHLFAPAITSSDSNAPTGSGTGLFSFLHFQGSLAANTTDSSDKSTRLAAFLASENGGDTGSASAAPLAPTVTQTPVPGGTSLPIGSPGQERARSWRVLLVRRQQPPVPGNDLQCDGPAVLLLLGYGLEPVRSSNTGYKWRHVPNRFHPHRGYREYECHCTAGDQFCRHL